MVGRGRSRLAASESFGSLYRRHSDNVLIFIARRVYDREVAMDLTAETFARAFVSRRRFRGSTEAEAEAWIYTIARRQIANYVRRGKAERRAIKKLGIEVPSLSDEDLERIDQLAGLGELREAVATGLEELSPSQRDALSLRVVEELPYPEVAERLGISEQTARARVSRGLRVLTKLVEANPIAKEVCG
jgi:RNA polymerase sigma factor (sigma-70 family)